MKKLLLLMIAGCMTSMLKAQDLPQPSPVGKVEQTVGLTQVSVEYSRPSAKNRKIFGDLVPYGKIWRLGANGCTKFTCSTDIEFNGKTLAAGTYAMFATPNESGDWTVVFNTDTEQWGAYAYDDQKNAIEITVKANDHAFTETLAIGVSNITNTSASISIAWEKLQIDIPFTVKTDVFVKANIEAAVKKGENLDVVYYRAASYAFKSLKNEDLAMDYLNKSFAVKKAHNSLFLKAQILKGQGNTKGAIEAAKEALKLAEAAEKKGWVDYIKENIEAWEG